jgi:hypothetical protein
MDANEVKSLLKGRGISVMSMPHGYLVTVVVENLHHVKA